MEKYQANTDETFRARAIGIKEERADLVKHHLDVLWHDYFKPEHVEKVPNLHDLFWKATKQASKVKASVESGGRQGAARSHRRGRRGVEGDRRRGEDQGRRPAQLTEDLACQRSPVARRGFGASGVRGASRWSRAAWLPAIEPGDWLLVDPTTIRWPRRGSVVVFHEPDGGGARGQARGRGSGSASAVRRGATSSWPTTRRWLVSPMPPPRTPPLRSISTRVSRNGTLSVGDL